MLRIASWGECVGKLSLGKAEATQCQGTRMYFRGLPHHPRRPSSSFSGRSQTLEGEYSHM